MGVCFYCNVGGGGRCSGHFGTDGPRSGPGLSTFSDHRSLRTRRDPESKGSILSVLLQDFLY